MPSHYSYLLVDVLCVLVPFIASFHPQLQFYKQWKFFAVPCILTALFFIIWDCFFTAKGVWSFNSKYVTGIYLLNLPLEELLFFICIPYACVFTYYCFRKFLQLDKYVRASHVVAVVLAIVLSITGMLHVAQLYTSFTFFLLAGVLILMLLIRAKYLPWLLLSYVVLQLPFILSNGWLTGSFNNEAIVMYNGEYNLGIRILNIPFEDIFYGMLLFSMNIVGYEFLRNHSETVYRTPLKKSSVKY